MNKKTHTNNLWLQKGFLVTDHKSMSWLQKDLRSWSMEMYPDPASCLLFSLGSECTRDLGDDDYDTCHCCGLLAMLLCPDPPFPQYYLIIYFILTPILWGHEYPHFEAAQQRPGHCMTCPSFVMLQNPSSLFIIKLPLDRYFWYF